MGCGCRLFGQAGSPYDFSGVQMEHVKNTCAELEERNKGMKKKVNPKVLNMLDRYVITRHSLVGRLSVSLNERVQPHSVEKKEKDLTRMLTQVLNDKKKIEETIKKLDDYKRGALQKTWEKVNGWVPSVQNHGISLLNKVFGPAATLAISSTNCCPEISPNCNRRRVRTSRKGSRSKFG